MLQHIVDCYLIFRMYSDPEMILGYHLSFRLSASFPI
jgi:hypothetical protein